MYHAIVLWFTFLNVEAFTVATNRYVNPDLELQKCCPPEKYLLEENNTLTCQVPQKLYDLEMNPSSFSDYTSDCAEQCVDLLMEGDNVDLVKPGPDCRFYTKITDFVKYPKCCPLLHAYDPSEHKCVKNQSVTFEKTDGVFVKVDLSQCRSSTTALIDYLNETKIDIDAARGITLSDRKYFVDGHYCLDVNAATGGLVVRTCQSYKSACKSSFDDVRPRCLRKCCPDGQMFKHGGKCVRTYDQGINITADRIKNWDDKIFGIIQTDAAKKYMAKPKHLFFIDKDGYMQVQENSRWERYGLDEAFYCIEQYEPAGGSPQEKFYLFFHSGEEATKFQISVVLLSTSCVFLFLTILCYALLPDMQNLFGKLVLVYCSVMLVAFSILAYVQASFRSVPPTACIVYGFLIIFFFIACFTWMNIICFDMWMAFGQMRVITMYNKRKEWKRFLYYNIYGWGFPSAVVLLTLTVYKTKCLPDYLVPHIGDNRCFFDKWGGTYDHLLFFVLPLTVLLVANLVLFVKTIMYCFKVKDEINRMKSTPNSDKAKRNKTFQADKEKLTMLLKLFLIMGISWLFEVASSLYSFDSTEGLFVTQIVWDSFNSLEGVFIFIIFICKKKVYVSLKNKLLGQKVRRNSESSTTMTSVYAAGLNNGRKSSELRMPKE